MGSQLMLCLERHTGYWKMGWFLSVGLFPAKYEVVKLQGRDAKTSSLDWD